MDNTTTSSSSITNVFKSNSLISNIVFLLIVFFVFVLVLQIATSLLSYLFNHFRNHPKLIDGMVDASQTLIIPTSPDVTGAKVIPRSKNETDGIEFTWSLWVFINDLGKQDNKYRHIFHKGNVNLADSGLNFPNNAPGMYLSPNKNEFTIIMNTFENINEEIKVTDVPMNKWVNVIIRCNNKTLDVYVNGIITKSVQLSSVPKQNIGDVYVGLDGGFNGYISNLWYWGYSLNASQILHLVNSGPNTKMKTSSMSLKNPNYLSMRWYWTENSQ